METTERTELTEQNLELVNGGRLTDEADAWFRRNIGGISSRIGKDVVSYCMGRMSSSIEYNVAGLKKAIKDKYGISVDDLE